MEDVFREVKREIDFFTTSQLDFPSHLHEDIELVFVLSGRGAAYCDGVQYPLTDRCMFLAFPNQVHQYVGCDGGRYILLVLKPSHLLGDPDVFLKGYPTHSLVDFSKCDDDRVISLLHVALEEYERDGYNLVIKAYLTAFFEKLLRFYTVEKEAVSSDTVLRILQFCSAHYKEDITITDVADKLQLSKSTVSHIFSTRLGMGFCNHINSLRLTDAVRLLKNKHYSVTDVSTIAGFPTTRTFNRVFHAQYGMSPSTYRKTQT